MKKHLKTLYDWTIRSKAFWGVVLVVGSPLTGPLAPGVAKAGELLIVVGAGDKAARFIAPKISKLFKKEEQQ